MLKLDFLFDNNMKKILFIFLFLQSFVFAQTEYKYDHEKSYLPEWVKEMYSDNPDPGKIESLYRNYYQKNEFIKNKHTQYYKRWQRSLSRKISKKSNYKHSRFE